MGRRKTNAIVKAETFNRTAERYATLFIATQKMKGAEKLAQRILEKIRANKERLAEKYGE